MYATVRQTGHRTALYRKHRALTLYEHFDHMLVVIPHAGGMTTSLATITKEVWQNYVFFTVILSCSVETSTGIDSRQGKRQTAISATYSLASVTLQK